MRELLSELITHAAQNNPDVVVLSGDHGYALFDAIRKARPQQFVNVGVMEQAMIGIAAGLAKTGSRPIVYGLSAFVPIRVLEQIKLDLCYSKLPVILLGDGAGLVYSTLGASHQCGEDLAALRPMPHISIFSPADDSELRACFEAALKLDGPSYIRVGKSDRSKTRAGVLKGTEPIFQGAPDSKVCLVTTGSMSSIGLEAAEKLGAMHVSVPRLKPFPTTLVRDLEKFEKVVVIEEHSRYGGLCSAIMDSACEVGVRPPRLVSFSLRDQFAERCGTWQYALSEHGLDDKSILERLKNLF